MGFLFIPDDGIKPPVTDTRRHQQALVPALSGFFCTIFNLAIRRLALMKNAGEKQEELLLLFLFLLCEKLDKQENIVSRLPASQVDNIREYHQSDLKRIVIVGIYHHQSPASDY